MVKLGIITKTAVLLVRVSKIRVHNYIVSEHTDKLPIGISIVNSRSVNSCKQFVCLSRNYLCITLLYKCILKGYCLP